MEKRIAIMGCSGRIHGVARNLTTLNPNIKVVALFDPLEEACLRLKETFSDATTYLDQNKMFDSEEFEWVLVGSLNAAHADNICDAMQSGKDVFSEKPLAISIEQLKRIQDVMRDTGRKLIVGFNLRYSPLYREMHNLVLNGAIGEVLSFELNETLHPNHGSNMLGGWRAHSALSGPMLLEKCTHDVDIMLWTIGSLPKKVASFGGADFFTPQNAHHQQRLGKNKKGENYYYVGGMSFDDDKGLQQESSPFMKDKDVVDNQVAILELYNGARGTFHLNLHAGLDERRMYLVGTEGALRTDMKTGMIELQRNGWDEPSWSCCVYKNGVALGHGGGDDIMGTELGDVILNDAEIKTKYIDGFKSAVTCLMVDQAMHEEVILNLDDCWKSLNIDPHETQKYTEFRSDYFKNSKYDYQPGRTFGHPTWSGAEVDKSVKLEH